MLQSQCRVRTLLNFLRCNLHGVMAGRHMVWFFTIRFALHHPCISIIEMQFRITHHWMHPDIAWSKWWSLIQL